MTHLLLNALFLDPGGSGGPETYLRNLAPAVKAARPDTRVTVATTRSGARALAADGWNEWADVRAFPCEEGQRGRRQFSEQVLLPGLARRLNVDFLHSLANVGPMRTPGTPHVITLHDVIFFKERTFGRVTTFGMRQVVSRAARHADQLISGSAAARDEVVAELAIDPQRFTVVHHGATPAAPGSAAPEARVRERLGLGDRRVVLCVAAKRPHKNQELLVRAAERLPADVVIVLAGHPEPYDRELRSLAAVLGASEKVIFADYVPPDDLEALWDMAACAAFPTRAEGFGLPLIEALLRGVPVACSDLPVLREVGGEFPFFFEPDDPEGAARAVESASATPRPLPGAREWAATFTWEAAAEGTWGVYDRVLAG